MSQPQTLPKVRFPSPSPFMVDLRARVDAYFDGADLPRTANAAMVWKSIFWVGLAAASFAVTLAEAVPFPASLAVSALTGLALACVGFNVGHDAIHGSYAKRAWVNHVLSWTFDVMGASSATWSVFHNVIHHTYTNICGVDQDLEPGPFLRFYPRAAPPSRVQRFQHLYAWVLYGFIGFVWVLVKDFRQMRAPHPLTGRRPPARVVAGVLIGKAAHVGLFVALPLAIVQRPAWQTLMGYAVMMFAAGVTLAIVFQLAHVVEGVTFRTLPADGVVLQPWAEHELASTADFGRWKLTTFVTGGLDHQVEHHLFPRICHIHYPALAPIVTTCARDHGLVALNSGRFVSAVASHARVLARLGRGDVEADRPLDRRTPPASVPPVRPHAASAAR